MRSRRSSGAAAAALCAQANPAGLWTPSQLMMRPCIMLPSGDAQGHGLLGSPPRSLPYRPYRDREHLARRDSESRCACQWASPGGPARPSAYPSSSELRELALKAGHSLVPGPWTAAGRAVAFPPKPKLIEKTNRRSHTIGQYPSVPSQTHAMAWCLGALVAARQQ